MNGGMMPDNLQSLEDFEANERANHKSGEGTKPPAPKSEDKGAPRPGGDGAPGPGGGGGVSPEPKTERIEVPPEKKPPKKKPPKKPPEKTKPKPKGKSKPEKKEDDWTDYLDPSNW
jgi:hypothetical protein